MGFFDNVFNNNGVHKVEVHLVLGQSVILQNSLIFNNREDTKTTRSLRSGETAF